MARNYKHLTTQERAVVMTMRDDLCSIRSIAKRLCRSASTIGREIKRTADTGLYDANRAHLQCLTRRTTPRRLPKLHADSILLEVVRHQLKLLWSPQKIARKLRLLWPNTPEKTVSHETIYNAIYLHPRGELKRELIACLRHHNQVRKPRSRGTDRRGQIPDMQSIHIRPPEIEDRIIPGHWEGDLIKGAGNRSSVGTLVERTTGFVVRAKMDNATTKAVVHSFFAVLNREPAAMRKTMTYDQGREMHGHKILTERTGVQIYFADPHSPWQRGSNENTNGLLRQYMPKGSDLSIYSQDELDAIALSLNSRPRARLGFESPLVVYTQQIAPPSQVTIGHDGWLYLGDQYEQTLTLTVTRRGSIPADVEAARKIALATAGWEQWLASQGVQAFYIVLGPNKDSVYGEWHLAGRKRSSHRLPIPSSLA